MNIYHITYAPAAKIVHLHFWGCNLSCRACLLKKELYDCHLPETKDNIFNPTTENSQVPERFLDLAEVMRILENLEVSQVVFMGAEAALDSQLPQLTGALHKEFNCHNVLLTNGLKFIDPESIDEVMFSLKAYDDYLHLHYTGKSNKEVLKNFVKYHDSGVKLRAESILIPEYIDYPQIESIAKYIATIDKTISYRIDAHIPIGDNPWRRPTLKEMERAVSAARKHLLNVSCLTGNEDLKFDVMKVF